MQNTSEKFLHEAKAAGSWATGTSDPADLYLELLKWLLCAGLQERVVYPVAPAAGWRNRVFEPVSRILGTRGFLLARSKTIGPHTFAKSPPPRLPGADTMIGPVGLENIRECHAEPLGQIDGHRRRGGFK
jgi:hypothetical protein